MNKLNLEKQSQIIKVLCEGNSIRSTSRITGTAVNTVVKLLREVGAACLDYQDRAMHNLPCKKLQCDEIWSFVYSKAKNVPDELILQRIMGHAHLSTTKIYRQLRVANLCEQHHIYSPLNMIMRGTKRMDI